MSRKKPRGSRPTLKGKGVKSKAVSTDADDALVLALTEVLIEVVTVLSPTKRKANENLERLANRLDDSARDEVISGTETGAFLRALAKCLIETEPTG